MAFESEALFPEPARMPASLSDFDVRDLEARLAYELAHQRIASEQGRVALFSIAQDGSMQLPEEAR